MNRLDASVSRGLLLSALVLTMAWSGLARAAELLRVNAFATLDNVSLYVAQEKGFFGEHGLKVDIQFTPNSDAQRMGLLKGLFDVAESGVDNAVALSDAGHPDVIIVAGGSDGMNELMVRPEIASYADLRGKTMVVDAPNTAFALLLYKMLAVQGLQKQDYSVLPVGAYPARLKTMKSDPRYAAAMLNPPCDELAKEEGMKSLGFATAVVGPYQAVGVWTMRPWAQSHRSLLVRYLQSLIEARRWAADPARRGEIALIAAKYLKTDQHVIEASLDEALGSKPGVSPDAKLDLKAFEDTLALRAQFLGKATPRSAADYLDLSFWTAAESASR